MVRPGEDAASNLFVDAPSFAYNRAAQSNHDEVVGPYAPTEAEPISIPAQLLLRSVQEFQGVIRLARDSGCPSSSVVMCGFRLFS
jgi:hypothetical protein